MAEGWPSSKKNVLCRYFVHGACQDGSNCQFSHDYSHPQSLVCKYYMSGRCHYGTACRYDHQRPNRGRQQQLPGSRSTAQSHPPLNAHAKEFQLSEPPLAVPAVVPLYSFTVPSACPYLNNNMTATLPLQCPQQHPPIHNTNYNLDGNHSNGGLSRTNNDTFSNTLESSSIPEDGATLSASQQNNSNSSCSEQQQYTEDSNPDIDHLTSRFSLSGLTSETSASIQKNSLELAAASGSYQGPELSKMTVLRSTSSTQVPTTNTINSPSLSSSNRVNSSDASSSNTTHTKARNGPKNTAAAGQSRKTATASANGSTATSASKSSSASSKSRAAESRESVNKGNKQSSQSNTTGVSSSISSSSNSTGSASAPQTSTVAAANSINNKKTLAPVQLPNSSWADAPEFVPRQYVPTAREGLSWANVAGGTSNGNSCNSIQYASAGVIAANPYSELCPYFLMRHECHLKEQCPYVHGQVCDMCQLACLDPRDTQQRKEHAEECARNMEDEMEHSFAVARSKDKPCGICMDIVMERSLPSQRRFGILPNCSHIYCLDCIRKWRASKQFENKIIRSCPECRIQSDYIIPSRYWVDENDKEEKKKLVDSYRDALCKKECKYFNKGEGTCPFGNKCFYRHALADGTVKDVGPPRRRRRLGQDGEVQVYLDNMVLWDFIDEREHRLELLRGSIQSLLLELELEDLADNFFVGPVQSESDTELGYVVEEFPAPDDTSAELSRDAANDADGWV